MVEKEETLYGKREGHIMEQHLMKRPVVDAVEIPSDERPAHMHYPMPVFAPTEAGTTDAARRLAFLCELPSQFEAEMRLDVLLQTMTEQLVDMIPGATRSALLLLSNKVEGAVFYSSLVHFRHISIINHQISIVNPEALVHLSHFGSEAGSP